jgi:uncharacterized protein YdhG (YjbR/CyaY superfamily)
MKNVTTIDDYIKDFQEEIQKNLEKFRKIIHDLAPTATESISYGVPTFKLNSKNLVHFAAFSDHYSFFPTSSPRAHFKELEKYKGGKGTIIFPFNEDIPWDLVKKMTEFRIKELSK